MRIASGLSSRFTLKGIALIWESPWQPVVNLHRFKRTSGEKMLCDRELVYESLSNLYSRHGQGQSPLEEFNRRVRERLGPRILQQLRVNVPLRYTVSMVLVSTLPLLSWVIWIISQGPDEPLAGLDYAVWCTREILQLVQGCLAITFSFPFTNRLLKLRKLKLFKDRAKCLSACLAPVLGFTIGFVWASFEFAKALSEDTSLLPLLPFSLAVALNILLYYF